MIILEGTKLKANASADRTKSKDQYQQWLERIDADIKNILDEAAQADDAEDEQYGDNRVMNYQKACIQNKSSKKKSNGRWNRSTVIKIGLI